MIDKLTTAERTYKELQLRMSDPEVAANATEFQKVRSKTGTAPFSGRLVLDVHARLDTARSSSRLVAVRGHCLYGGPVQFPDCSPATTAGSVKPVIHL
jgi:hypothetical protein